MHVTCRIALLLGISLSGVSRPAEAQSTGCSFGKAPATSSRDDPFVGNCILLGDSVHMGRGGRYNHARLSVTRDSSWITSTIIFFDDSGSEQRSQQRMREDGRDYTGTGGNTMSVERTGTYSKRQVEKRNGRVVGRYEHLLSPDAQTLCIAHVLVDEASGATTAIRFQVFKRVP